MEKKTIGALIAALRKANGMTQRDLADRLHVSDKTVSRWERDEGTPDLALIPVIAEIFCVSCDELLRGERKPPEDRSAPEGENATAKGEKQRQWLLKSTLSSYQTQCYYTMLLSAIGLICALICNLAFLKAVLGFLLGAIFFLSSIIFLLIMKNQAFLSVEDAGLDAQSLSAFHRRVLKLSEQSIALTVGLTGFTFPMLLVDAHVGLGMTGLLIYGATSAAAFLVAYAVICYFVNASLLKRGLYILNDAETAVYRHNHSLKRILAIILVVLLAVTCLTHMAAAEIWGPYSIMDGTTFDDYESFITFMEQDIPNSQSPDTQIKEIYFDENGNEISQDEALIATLEDQHGKVVCSYIDRNKSVISIRYVPQEGTILPITVCTQQDLIEAQNKVAIRNLAFGAAYCLEVVVILLLYVKKRKKYVSP